MTMQGQDVREVFEEILPDEALLEAVEAAGLQQRERRLNALLLLRSMVVSASTGYGGRQADAMKLYFESGGARVVRGGFYRWFGPALERAMERVRDLALGYVGRQAVDLPGLLGRTARDWHIVDATTVRLADELKDEYPGAGDYAALKVHKRYSVGLGTTVAYHLSPAREHDGPHLRIDESWRGLGLLVDLGYASLTLLADCDRYGVSYVMRLKENWKPKVLHLARGSVSRTFVSGADFDLLLQRDVLKLDGKLIDADVELGRGSRAVVARLVGVPTTKGYCFYLTNLNPKVAPRAVADLYRVRWEIELDNKLDKSCLRLADIGAKTGPAVRALAHAAMVASIIVCMLAHHHRRREAPAPRGGAERTKPPLHPQALARMVGVAAHAIGRAFELSGPAAQAEWQRLAKLFNGETDPDWRRRPSVLDQMRGWRITPGQPKRVRIAQASLN